MHQSTHNVCPDVMAKRAGMAVRLISEKDYLSHPHGRNTPAGCPYLRASQQGGSLPATPLVR